MAELLGEHRQHDAVLGQVQPVGIEVDRGGAAGIGAQGPRHRRAVEQLHSWQINRVAGSQTSGELPQGLWYGCQPECLLRRTI